VADATVAFTGWNASVGWGQSTWGDAQPALPLGEGAVGSVLVTASAEVLLTGVSATASVGQSTVAADAVVELTGVSATGEVGQVEHAGDAVVELTG